MTMSSLSWLVLAFCLSLLVVLHILKYFGKDVAFGEFRFVEKSNHRNSRTSEEEPLSKSPALKSSELVTILPPSRREQLKDILPALPPTQQSSERSLVGLEEGYTNADDSKYLCSGFSIREIKTLGDFPDYSNLSGVPMPQPYSTFNIDKARPRPYRPFRWQYHQTMSLMKLEPDWWIELESTYKERIALRKRLYATHGPGIAQWLPGSELACKELLEMVIQFLCARYPQYFTLSEDKLWLENKILGVRAEIRAKHPLLILLDHVPEDFAIMLRDPETGRYVLRAGIICSAIGWSIENKIGLPLHEIHQDVPDYKQKMQFSMDRAERNPLFTRLPRSYFSKMPTDKPIQRASWELKVDQPLYMPPKDPRSAYQDEKLTRSRVHLRVDWQTLRRLPLSGGIAFNFKTFFTPIEEFRDEPYVPSLLLQVLRCGNEEMLKYKGTWPTEHVVIPTLKEFEQEQKETGLMEKDWQIQTLTESPWFPGWERKWHAQQGF